MTSGLFRRVRFPCFVLAVALYSAWAEPQIAPDEARARTQPYIPPSAVIVRTQVELVEVPVVVRDRQHQAVSGLRQSDFAVYDAGKKQEITAFSVESFVPGSAGAPVPDRKSTRLNSSHLGI